MGGQKCLITPTLHWVFLSSSIITKASWPAGPFHTENQLNNMHCMRRHCAAAQNSLNSSHSVSLKRLGKFMSRKYVFWIIQTKALWSFLVHAVKFLDPSGLVTELQNRSKALSSWCKEMKNNSWLLPREVIPVPSTEMNQIGFLKSQYKETTVVQGPEMQT